jgi:hypothetical protein
MIDTVWLMTRDFDLQRQNRFRIKQDISPAGEVERTKRYCNLSDDGAGKAVIEIRDMGGPVCLFNGSLPKMLFGHSLKEIGPSDYDRCIEEIGNQFTTAGVMVDKTAIPDMELTRVDFCKNITVEWPAVDYTSLLSSCLMGRMKSKHTPPYTALWRNGSRQFTAYDKVQEILSDKDQRQASGLTAEAVHNVLRLESRVKGGAKGVRRQLPGSTFGKLFSRDLALQRLLHDFDSLKVDPDAQDRYKDATLSDLLQAGSTRRVNSHYAMKGLYDAVDGDVDRFRGLLESTGKGKRQVRRWVGRFMEFKDQQRAVRERDMLAEVRSKLTQ